MNDTPPKTLFGFRQRTLAILIVVALVACAALALDLLSEGLVYDYLWRVTGETRPASQLLGFGQYLAGFTRDRPETQPYARVENADVNPFGVNTFLEQEVELEKRERQVQMIADAGFGWIRQQFRWDDIEIHAKGDFTDRRNDPAGISAWDKYDHIVGLAEEYGLNILARLSDPPAWSRPEGTTNPYTPPANYDDFADYARTVAERYRGRIHYYQVWNEPNLYPEWGDQTVNAEAYTDLLCRTYAALKAVDPEIVVITGALGPTIDLSGRNAYDLLYLQRMYQAGAGACFDVLSVQGYGLWSGPTDHRLRQTTINYPRHLWLRDMMIANGDAHKPIWISEAGWNPVPDDPSIANQTYYGQVTPQEAAEWAPLAYARAIEDWPWIGVITWWYFKRADESEMNQSWYYFRLVEPDFTPTPVYDALKAYMTGAQPKTIGAGRHGTQHHSTVIAADSGGETRLFRISGTGLDLCYDDPPVPPQVFAAADGGPEIALDVPGSGSGCVPVFDDLAPGEHTITITASDWAGLNSVAVFDFGLRHRLPWILAGIIAGLGVLAVLLAAIASRLRRA